jgi:hypothetical protein
MPEVGIKESGIIGKRKGADTEKGRNGKRQKEKRQKRIWQNQVFTKPEKKINQKGTKTERGRNGKKAESPFHQAGKGPKRKGAKTQSVRNEKKHYLYLGTKCDFKYDSVHILAGIASAPVLHIESEVSGHSLSYMHAIGYDVACIELFPILDVGQ